MEKQKRWQFYLILAVIIITLYNILPTVFFYSKPLKSPVDASKAEQVATSIVERVDRLEQDSLDWLHSFTKLLGLKPTSIALRENNPRLIDIHFANASDAAIFNRFLPKAGELIPFPPSQLSAYPDTLGLDPSKVTVARTIGVDLEKRGANKLFQFSPKFDENGQVSALYKEIVYDRMTQLALSFGGASKNAVQLSALSKTTHDSTYNDLVMSLAKEIVDTSRFLGSNSPILKRYYASFTQTDSEEKASLIQKFLARMDSLKSELVSQKEVLLKEKQSAETQNQFLDSSKHQALSLLEGQIQSLDSASILVNKNSAEFNAGLKPLSLSEIHTTLEKGVEDRQNNIQILNLEGRNPFVEALVLDWGNDKIVAKFYSDVQAMRLNEGKTEAESYLKDKINQSIINDIATVSRITDETISPDGDTFSVMLNKLTNTTGILTFDLGQVAAAQSEQLLNQMQNEWHPKHTDLSKEAYPVVDYNTYKSLKPEEQRLGFVVYAPAMHKEPAPAGFRTGSIYLIARGMDAILQNHRQHPDSPETQQLIEDVTQLNQLMQVNGFIGYPGSSFGMAPEFSKDYIYELDDYYSELLKATREDFSVKGSKRQAVLDFTDVEQRILAQNKIDDSIQEDLLKWEEEYNTAQVDMNVTNHYLVPAPSKNPYWENFKLSFAKYFRGDDRKVLKWGLDLSGGKTVRIGLRDHNGRPVTNPEDLNQAVNELYTRINKMGVSERAIHIEGQNIILDFPGMQGVSATDLVRASAMYFHVVNEKFGPLNTTVKDSVQQFLQDVWNEAVVTNRKDVESINEIAWQHLGGDVYGDIQTRPRSDAAQALYESGLRLPSPKDKRVSSEFNDTLSSVVIMQGSDFSDWHGQTHPLMFVFHNYALEGSNLNNIQVGYDPAEGNILSFGVKTSYEGSDKRQGSPRDDFYAWTSQFAEDRIVGTPKESYSQGRGWRMAVVLNDSVISQPTLRAGLRDGATISGRFSQREINQLAADLKAGSLSFTPKILSEDNVSPELGQEERTKGIVASIVAILLVVIAMTAYYRFAGFVASCAVLFNILIMWGVLQNLDAALTLPGIAGIVLAIGMAVDANVLVFERIREEFAISGRIASAIQAGYRKAFSAIVDSNITTIIAALVLIQFDSGPIKGFAVTLIIGIVSSMFTALFMTRYFFAGWVQNPKNKELKMSHFIGNTNIDFLGKAKAAFALSMLLILVGGYFFVAQSKTMFGMDFTGGYSLNVELEEKPGDPSYRVEAATALLSSGATSNDFQIRELSKPNQLRIQLGTGMEEKGHPFYQMPETNAVVGAEYSYEENPRIVWLVNALAKENLKIKPAQLETLDRNWTAISGQFSDAMRNNALMGIAIALLGILAYITVRFEFKFAIAAVIGLAHDVLITLGILALFHRLGFPVQIDLQVVGAIMTIIGYSLNDTIIVFDRIREDMKILRKLKFSEIINHALNVTLSRTLMTSGTTLLVLLALVFLGGKSIFAFSLVMTIGVVVGTLSSLFIASPVLLYFHNREVSREEGSKHPSKA
jgi:SecD/SecF fusion protein